MGNMGLGMPAIAETRLGPRLMITLYNGNVQNCLGSSLGSSMQQHGGYHTLLSLSLPTRTARNVGRRLKRPQATIGCIKQQIHEGKPGPASRVVLYDEAVGGS